MPKESEDAAEEKEREREDWVNAEYDQAINQRNEDRKGCYKEEQVSTDKYRIQMQKKT